MKVFLQKTPDLTALLLDENNKIIASETGCSDLEAVGRLVATNPSLFNLEEVSTKFGRPIEGLVRR